MVEVMLIIFISPNSSSTTQDQPWTLGGAPSAVSTETVVYKM